MKQSWQTCHFWELRQTAVDSGLAGSGGVGVCSQAAQPQHLVPIDCPIIYTINQCKFGVEQCPKCDDVECSGEAEENRGREDGQLTVWACHWLHNWDAW